MPFTLNDIPNCYYLSASFHGKEKNDNGYEFKIWANRGRVLVSCREQIMGKHGAKKYYDSVQEALDYCREFITGEKAIMNEKFVLYILEGNIDTDKPDSIQVGLAGGRIGSILGVFPNINSMLEHAKKLILQDPSLVLYAASFYATLKFEVALIQEDKQRINR